jgi:DNA-binding transcriptional LysR family regulator
LEPKDFDLNLLRSLDALLEEVNVTRAAERLYITQPAMSGALRRLREYFNDELLVRSGQRMERTPMGESLRDPVRTLLSDVQAAVETCPRFDPKTSEESFSVSISDYGALILMPEVLRLLSADAPHVSCNVQLLCNDAFAQLEKGDLDFVIAADHWGLYGNYKPTPDICTAELFRDDFVCVVDRGNEMVGGDLTVERYCALPHNSVSFGRGVDSLVEVAWDAAGLSLQIMAKAPDFSSLVLMVPGTPLIATAQRRLCEALSPAFPLRILECPIPIQPLCETMVWHVRSESDPAHRFMRDIFQKAATMISQ